MPMNKYLIIHFFSLSKVRYSVSIKTLPFPEQANDNIQYFNTSSRDRTYNMSHLQSHAQPLRHVALSKEKILIYLFFESGHDWYSLRNTPQETANRIEIARPIFSSNKINKSVNHTNNKGRKITGNKIQLHISVSAKIVHDKV